MQTDFFLFSLAGVLFGCITGLVPGLHTNNVSIAMLSLGLTGEKMAVFVLSMSISHSFVSFIPSTFLGIPEESNFVSLLPSQKLFLKGKAFTAVCLTVLGGLIAGITAIALLPAFSFFTKKAYSGWQNFFGFALLFVVVSITASEKNFLKALIVSASSFFLGLTALKFDGTMTGIISGLFAGSQLVFALQNKKSKQTIKQKIFFKEKNHFTSGFLAGLAGMLTALMPGLGSAQTAFLLSKILKQNKKSFLVLTGGITTANTLMAFPVLNLTGKTRTGSTIAVKQMLFNGFSNELLIVFSLFSIGVSGIATIFLAKKTINFFSKKDMKKTNFFVLLFLAGLSVYAGNLPGLLAFVVGTTIGWLAISFKIKRSNCMAFLLAPTLKLV